MGTIKRAACVALALCAAVTLAGCQGGDQPEPAKTTQPAAYCGGALPVPMVHDIAPVAREEDFDFGVDKGQELPSMGCELELDERGYDLDLYVLFVKPKSFGSPNRTSSGLSLGHGLTGMVTPRADVVLYRWCTRGSQKRLFSVTAYTDIYAGFWRDGEEPSVRQSNGVVRLAARLSNDFARRVGCQEPPMPEPTAAVTSFAAMTYQPRPAPLPGGKICGLATPQALGFPAGRDWLTAIAPPRSTPMEACVAEIPAKERYGDPEARFEFAIARDVLADPALYRAKADDQTVNAPRYRPIPGTRGRSGQAKNSAWLHTTCHGKPVVYRVDSSGQRGVTPAEQLRLLVTAVEKRDGCERSFS